MTDARSKAVLGELADLYSRTNYVSDKMSSLNAPLSRGDIVEVPDIDALTVNTSGASDNTPESVTTNILSLNANLEPFINAEIPQRARMQTMDGNWANQVATQATVQLKNSIDESLCRDYLAESLCWTTGTASTYHFNENGSSLDESDVLDSKAYMLSQDGVQAQNLAFFVSSYCEGSIAGIAGFIPNGAQAEQGNLGIPRIGTVFGVPVYTTNSVRRNKTFPVTTSQVASNVLTCDVTAGHGVVAGQLLSNSSFTDSATNTGSIVVTSTTSTTIVMAFTASDDATYGTGTLTDATSWNLLCDTSQLFVAQSLMPTLRIVPYRDRTSDAMQISSIWGRIGRAGRAVVVHSPGSST